jgi:hypothetical protein
MVLWRSRGLVLEHHYNIDMSKHIRAEKDTEGQRNGRNKCRAKL